MVLTVRKNEFEKLIVTSDYIQKEHRGKYAFNTFDYND